MATTLLLCPFRVVKHWPFFKSHTRGVKFQLPDTARLPLGVTAMDQTQLVCLLNVDRHCKLSKFHKRRVLSQLPEMARLPSGVTATAVMSHSCHSNATLHCPFSILMRQFPVSTSHTRRVASELPDIARLPSGDTATALIFPVCPTRVRISGKGRVFSGRLHQRRKHLGDWRYSMAAAATGLSSGWFTAVW